MAERKREQGEIPPEATEQWGLLAGALGGISIAQKAEQQGEPCRRATDSRGRGRTPPAVEGFSGQLGKSRPVLLRRVAPQRSRLWVQGGPACPGHKEPRGLGGWSSSWGDGGRAPGPGKAAAAEPGGRAPGTKWLSTCSTIKAASVDAGPSGQRPRGFGPLSRPRTAPGFGLCVAGYASNVFRSAEAIRLHAISSVSCQKIKQETSKVWCKGIFWKTLKRWTCRPAGDLGNQGTGQTAAPHVTSEMLSRSF